ncbi:hypothetical protein [Leifsonia aquatica]|uniref:hypothetical protein n=1 Tax=Leifsonia aquatica TaxID=144185 RepID=UPI00046810B8|nr:hypothetical protein [Leifsonia aquatica]
MSTHDKNCAMSGAELRHATDSALETLAWSEHTGCDARSTSLGGGFICYQCGYHCECIVCRGGSDDREPLPEFLDGLDFDQWAPDAIEKMSAELSDFIESNSADLDGLDYGQIAHDFILTRNASGIGFWDRGLGERGTRLTAATKPYGEIHAWANHETRTLDFE